ncbi:MAG: RNA-guided endonuclease InsQ/TnpB family protein, partial [Candidatus Bipolaricaulia bacterium]
MAAFQAKMDTKVKGSRRWKRLKQAKDKRLRRLDNQIRDVLHKATTGLVSTLASEGVQTLVIGDVRDIRQDLDYGPTANQKLHQWPCGRTRWYLSYKAEARGMRWVLQDEAYTSQTCPSCGRRKQVNGRVYRCSCGFVGHRDHVGAFNILAKYLGHVPVVGHMARPTGWRYQTHARVARGLNLKPREAAAL